jgi:hypothetical protein
MIVFLIPFRWQAGGAIKWDYHVSSVPVYTDNKHRYPTLEAICILFLASNFLIELKGELIKDS